MEICQLYPTAAKTTSKEQESFSCKQISIFRVTDHLHVKPHFKSILSSAAWLWNNTLRNIQTLFQELVSRCKQMLLIKQLPTGNKTSSKRSLQVWLALAPTFFSSSVFLMASMRETKSALLTAVGLDMGVTDILALATCWLNTVFFRLPSDVVYTMLCTQSHSTNDHRHQCNHSQFLSPPSPLPEDI